MTKNNVLIVDSDKGFSTILSEGLNNHAKFKATAVRTGSKALQSVVEQPVDLVIIDMGIADMPPLKLVKAIREAKTDLPVMIIPFMGEDVPDGIKALGIQGMLPKPFFVGDLPRLVGEAIGLELESEIPDLPPVKAKKKEAPPPPPPAPVSEAAPEPPRSRPQLAPRTPSSGHRSDSRRNSAPPPPPRPTSSRRAPARTGAKTLPALPSWKLEQLQKNKDEVVKQLRDLNNEIRAEAILLTAGTTLIAKAGTMADDRAQELAVLVAESAEAASQAAAFLGERDAKFEQSLHEGNEFRLYSYSLGQGVVLSLALGINVPLGILRHQTKQTGQNLIKYIQ